MTKSSFLGKAPSIRVKVSKKTIDESMKRSSSHCMVAEAIKTQHPELSRVGVDIQTIRASNNKKGERYIWMTPRAIQQMIVDFDRGKKPEPFSFTARLGQKVETISYTSKEKKKMREQFHKRQKKAKFAVNKNKKNGASRVPTVVGGRTPPRSIASRREFGLKALNY